MSLALVQADAVSPDCTIQRVAQRPDIARRLLAALSASSASELPMEFIDEHRRFVLNAAEEAGLIHQSELLLAEAQAEIASQLAVELGIPLLGTIRKRSAIWRHGEVVEVMCNPSRSLAGGSIVFASQPINQVRVRIPDSVILAIHQHGRLFDSIDDSPSRCLWYLEPIYMKKGKVATSIDALKASSASEKIDPLVVWACGRPSPVSEPDIPLASARTGSYLFTLAHWD